ncbi:threonine/homoserine/homoserine lactone efflux protein [Actinoplanes campanulatus]|uniref:Threonine/homoserine/homoserine lactone efflux protein n=1 Tax=Actinoplanes campanulatus TaxID=113559 RepID=A0A7W5AJU0_9ACTN|nr:LysE family translocator [Actinoplanes campanulatus]MBB3097385.1 threonine/homoserine/homoserine lactone efflux protein [Actinoplanes campanulatus]GGN26601.1 lysine transporter LysE [Actinoplanes campanulatus]GID38153.1 lysine transporter LysE [Actinoplanes campanulatus]
MDLTDAVLSFALLGALLTITPGLDTALVLRAAVTMGRGPAFATALGIGAGALAWGAAAAVGASALLAASSVGYTILRVVGAAYMIFLGVRMIAAALRRGGRIAEAETAKIVPTFWSTFGRGFLTNLLNPKVGAFYLAVIPQFVPEGADPLATGLLLALVHDVEGLLWFAAIIMGAQAARGFLARRAVRRTVDAGTGAVLLGFGVRLGLSSQ